MMASSNSGAFDSLTRTVHDLKFEIQLYQDEEAKEEQLLKVYEERCRTMDAEIEQNRDRARRDDEQACILESQYQQNILNCERMRETENIICDQEKSLIAKLNDLRSEALQSITRHTIAIDHYEKEYSNFERVYKQRPRFIQFSNSLEKLEKCKKRESDVLAEREKIRAKMDNITNAQQAENGSLGNCRIFERANDFILKLGELKVSTLEISRQSELAAFKERQLEDEIEASRELIRNKEAKLNAVVLEREHQDAVERSKQEEEESEKEAAATKTVVEEEQRKYGAISKDRLEYGNNRDTRDQNICQSSFYGTPALSISQPFFKSAVDSQQQQEGTQPNGQPAKFYRPRGLLGSQNPTESLLNMDCTERESEKRFLPGKEIDKRRSDIRTTSSSLFLHVSETTTGSDYSRSATGLAERPATPKRRASEFSGIPKWTFNTPDFLKLISSSDDRLDCPSPPKRNPSPAVPSVDHAAANPPHEATTRPSGGNHSMFSAPWRFYQSPSVTDISCTRPKDQTSLNTRDNISDSLKSLAYMSVNDCEVFVKPKPPQLDHQPLQRRQTSGSSQSSKSAAISTDRNEIMLRDSDHLVILSMSSTEGCVGTETPTGSAHFNASNSFSPSSVSHRNGNLNQSSSNVASSDNDEYFEAERTMELDEDLSRKTTNAVQFSDHDQEDKEVIGVTQTKDQHYDSSDRQHQVVDLRDDNSKAFEYSKDQQVFDSTAENQKSFGNRSEAEVYGEGHQTNFNKSIPIERVQMLEQEQHSGGNFRNSKPAKSPGKIMIQTESIDSVCTDSDLIDGQGCGGEKIYNNKSDDSNSFLQVSRSGFEFEQANAVNENKELANFLKSHGEPEPRIIVFGEEIDTSQYDTPFGFTSANDDGVDNVENQSSGNGFDFNFQCEDSTPGSSLSRGFTFFPGGDGEDGDGQEEGSGSVSRGFALFARDDREDGDRQEEGLGSGAFSFF